MDLNLRKLLVAALLGSTASFAAACGGDDPEPGDDTGTDVDVDADGGDTGLDVPGDTGGGDGGTCENPCARTSECRAAGFENGICVDGCCEEQTTTASCARHLAVCDSDEATTDGFVCDTAAGLCLQRCSSDETLDARGGNCPVGSYCFADAVTDGPVDPVSGNTLDGVCGAGSCDGSIFDDAACEGVDLGDVTCTGDTCTCLPIANGASFCISAGTAAEGDACGLSDADAPPTSDSCEAGLLCFENTCTQPCDLNSPACDEGETCIEAYDVTTRNKPGICGVECTAYSSGECGDGFVCEPVIGRFDINAWMCMPAQGRDPADGSLSGPVGEGEECFSGTNTISGNCEEGFFCLQAEENGPSFCEKTCDPTGESDEALASCGGDAVGPQIVEPFGFGEATAYIPQPEGEITVDLRLADGTFVQSADLEFVDGEVNSIVATIGDYDTSALDLIAISDLVEGETLPAAGLRLLHASSDADPVDAYLTALNTVDFGDIAAVAVAPGAGFVRTWAGGAPLLDAVAATLAADTTTAVVVYVDGAAPTAATAAITAGTGGNSALYLFNASGADLDIYAGCDAGDAFGWDACDETAFVGTIANGDPATLAAVSVASAATTFFALEADADPATATTALTATATPAANAAHIVLLTEAGFVVSNAITNVAGQAQLVFVHAVDGGPTVAAGFEGAALVEGLAYGEPFGGDESAFLAIEAGSYALTVRGAGADATTAPALEAVISGEDLATYIVTGSAVGDDLQVVAIVDETIAAPAAGNGHVRAIHAGVGAPEVAIHLQGVSDQICTTRFIIDTLPGLCGEACSPYPRTGGGGYAGCDDAADSCIPYAPTEEPGETVAGYCGESDGDAGDFEPCGNPGQLGGDCADFAVCLAEEAGDTTGRCLPLCEPFSEDACGENSCSGVPPLLGSWELSFCLDDAQPGEALEDCTEEGLPCAGDHTLCLDLGDGAVCYPVCRGDFDDCADFDGTQCETGDLNPDVVPPFMGLCY